jgi:hypothetical protein
MPVSELANMVHILCSPVSVPIAVAASFFSDIQNPAFGNSLCCRGVDAIKKK